MSKIGNNEFREALEKSLLAVNLLNFDANKARYELSATLLRVDQPPFGTDLTVTTTVHYRVKDKETGKHILYKEIATSYTAKFSDEFLAPKRLAMANEGSARENISCLIRELYTLDVNAHELSIGSAL
jgi:hypothetical protein